MYYKKRPIEIYLFSKVAISLFSKLITIQRVKNTIPNEIIKNIILILRWSKCE